MCDWVAVAGLLGGDALQAVNNMSSVELLPFGDYQYARQMLDSPKVFDALDVRICVTALHSLVKICPAAASGMLTDKPANKLAVTFSSAALLDSDIENICSALLLCGAIPEFSSAHLSGWADAQSRQAEKSATYICGERDRELLSISTECFAEVYNSLACNLRTAHLPQQCGLLDVLLQRLHHQPLSPTLARLSDAVLDDGRAARLQFRTLADVVTSAAPLLPVMSAVPLCRFVQGVVQLGRHVGRQQNSDSDGDSNTSLQLAVQYAQLLESCAVTEPWQVPDEVMPYLNSEQSRTAGIMATNHSNSGGRVIGACTHVTAPAAGCQHMTLSCCKSCVSCTWSNCQQMYQQR